MALIAVGVLLVVPSALAKGPDTARICGASGCVTVNDVETVNVLALWGSALSARSQPPPEPFFTVDLTSSFGKKQKWSFLFAPSARAVKVIRADFSGGVYGVTTMNSWVAPADNVVAAYEAAVANVEPFTADAAWRAREDDGWSVPWLPVVAALAAAAAALAFMARVLTRRARPLAAD